MLQKLAELVAWYGDDYTMTLSVGNGKFAITIFQKGGKVINDTTFFDTLEYCVAKAYTAFIDHVAEDKGYGVYK